MRKKLFLTLGIVFIFGAIGLTGYNMWVQDRAGKITNDTLYLLNEHIDLALENGDTWDVPTSELDPAREMPAFEVDGRYYIGVLTIPDLGLSLPIMKDWSYPSLRRTPCRYEGSLYTHNLVIAAHNYRTHFGRLQELSENAPIQFTDVDGITYPFYVASMEVLRPTAIRAMVDSDYDLTLFTCTIGGRTRFTVRCNMQETTPQDDLMNILEGGEASY